MAIGRPCPSATRAASAGPATGPGVPGANGAPALRAMVRAAVLSPSASMAAGGGPIQVRPAAMTSRANCAFSARKPYPGGPASALDSADDVRIVELCRQLSAAVAPPRPEDAFAALTIRDDSD